MASGGWVNRYRALVQWSFDRFYNECAWSYDTVAWLVSRGLWQQWTLAAIPYLEGNVLELGCGTGYVQYALAGAHRPGIIVGLDASRSMLALTRRRAWQDGRSVTVLRGYAQRLPFLTGSFHTVLATFPSEYILHPATLQEIKRVLVANGRLVIADSAQFTSNGVYEQVVDLAYRLTFQHSVMCEQAVLSPYEPLLEQAGFAVALSQETVGPSQVMVIVGTRSLP